jgi:hypothetical protein
MYFYYTIQGSAIPGKKDRPYLLIRVAEKGLIHNAVTEFIAKRMVKTNLYSLHKIKKCQLNN